MMRQPQQQRSLLPGQPRAPLQLTAERWAHVVGPQSDARPIERLARALRCRKIAERAQHLVARPLSKYCRQQAG
eukprot:6925837-Pyramimonas_sp.AAC.1